MTDPPKPSSVDTSSPESQPQEDVKKESEPTLEQSSCENDLENFILPELDTYVEEGHSLSLRFVCFDLRVKITEALDSEFLRFGLQLGTFPARRNVGNLFKVGVCQAILRREPLADKKKIEKWLEKQMRFGGGVTPSTFLSPAQIPMTPHHHALAIGNYHVYIIHGGLLKTRHVLSSEVHVRKESHGDTGNGYVIGEDELVDAKGPLAFFLPKGLEAAGVSMRRSDSMPCGEGWLIDASKHFVKTNKYYSLVCSSAPGYATVFSDDCLTTFASLIKGWEAVETKDVSRFENREAYGFGASLNPYAGLIAWGKSSITYRSEPIGASNACISLISPGNFILLCLHLARGNADDAHYDRNPRAIRIVLNAVNALQVTATLFAEKDFSRDSVALGDALSKCALPSGGSYGRDFLSPVWSALAQIHVNLRSLSPFHIFGCKRVTGDGPEITLNPAAFAGWCGGLPFGYSLPNFSEPHRKLRVNVAQFLQGRFKQKFRTIADSVNVTINGIPAADNALFLCLEHMTNFPETTGILFGMLECTESRYSMPYGMAAGADVAAYPKYFSTFASGDEGRIKKMAALNVSFTSFRNTCQKLHDDYSSLGKEVSRHLHLPENLTVHVGHSDESRQDGYHKFLTNLPKMTDAIRNAMTAELRLGSHLRSTVNRDGIFAVSLGFRDGSAPNPWWPTSASWEKEVFEKDLMEHIVNSRVFKDQARAHNLVVITRLCCKIPDGQGQTFRPRWEEYGDRYALLEDLTKLDPPATTLRVVCRNVGSSDLHKYVNVRGEPKGSRHRGIDTPYDAEIIFQGERAVSLRVLSPSKTETQMMRALTLPSLTEELKTDLVSLTLLYRVCREGRGALPYGFVVPPDNLTNFDKPIGPLLRFLHAFSEELLGEAPFSEKIARVKNAVISEIRLKRQQEMEASNGHDLEWVRKHLESLNHNDEIFGEFSVVYEWSDRLRQISTHLSRQSPVSRNAWLGVSIVHISDCVPRSFEEMVSIISDDQDPDLLSLRNVQNYDPGVEHADGTVTRLYTVKDVEEANFKEYRASHFLSEQRVFSVLPQGVRYPIFTMPLSFSQRQRLVGEAHKVTFEVDTVEKTGMTPPLLIRAAGCLGHTSGQDEMMQVSSPRDIYNWLANTDMNPRHRIQASQIVARMETRSAAGEWKDAQGGLVTIRPKHQSVSKPFHAPPLSIFDKSRKFPEASSLVMTRCDIYE